MKGLLTKLLITPVDFYCNMACSYCYNGSSRTSSDPQIMGMNIIDRIFHEITPFLRGNRLIVIWHGGEPLLAGKDFYREALNVQSRAIGGRYQVTNCIQTNGTLVDEEWADCLAGLKIGPSVSLDGPAFLHDRIRKFVDNTPTYEQVMRGYRLLRERDVNTGMLMVISRMNMNEPEALWHWVLEQNILHFDMLPCIEPEKFHRGEHGQSLTSDEVARFYVRFFDLWFDNKNPNIKIRTFRDAIKGQMGGRVNICSWKASCMQHISFDATGNAYPCARYHPYSETTFGNILSVDFSNIMESITAKWVHEGIVLGQEKCKMCEWKDICGSGCPFLKYALYGRWDAPYIYCKSRQALYAHVRRRIFQDNQK